MGLLSTYKQRRKEDKAYKQILGKKLRTAQRQAYAEEAEKVAREKAKARARGGRYIGLRKVARGLAVKAITPKKTSTKRTTTKRRATKRRSYAKPKARKTIKPASFAEAFYSY